MARRGDSLGSRLPTNIDLRFACLAVSLSLSRSLLLSSPISSQGSQFSTIQMHHPTLCNRLFFRATHFSLFMHYHAPCFNWALLAIIRKQPKRFPSSRKSTDRCFWIIYIAFIHGFSYVLLCYYSATLIIFFALFSFIFHLLYSASRKIGRLLFNIVSGQTLTEIRREEKQRGVDHLAVRWKWQWSDDIYSTTSSYDFPVEPVRAHYTGIKECHFYQNLIKSHLFSL
jgi:hypothetical protein